MTRFIALAGPGSRDPEVESVAYEIGELLARAGAVLVCGGLAGAMEAACRGAKSAGGTTVGLLPGTTRNEANQFVDVPIPTGLGEARNVLVVRAADGVIAVGGGFGTLSEIALALKLGKPVVGVATWQPAREGLEVPIKRASTATEAVEMILAAT